MMSSNSTKWDGLIAFGNFILESILCKSPIISMIFLNSWIICCKDLLKALFSYNGFLQSGRQLEVAMSIVGIVVLEACWCSNPVPCVLPRHSWNKPRLLGNELIHRNTATRFSILITTYRLCIVLILPPRVPIHLPKHTGHTWRWLALQLQIGLR